MPNPLDEAFMSRAIELSKLGYPAPNPHVGCVIVKDGQIVGEGFHDFAGGPHAEIVALTAAGAQAKGGTAYVTMEPCNHQGRTGPCSEALIKAGISRVVIALPDPNSLASGGLVRLANAGIEVSTGVGAQEARKANLAWLFAMEHRRPYVVGKAAMSLDGRIALPNGESKWITGEASRRQAHILRAECGAILVGKGTIAADDPELTIRHIEVKNQPVRIVLDQDRTLAKHYRIFSNAGSTIRVVSSSPGENELECPVTSGRFVLESLLELLFERGITSLLVEGGSQTLSSFLHAGLIDRLELFIAPKFLGAGLSWLNLAPSESIQATPTWEFSEMRSLGSDLWLTAIPISRNDE